MVDIPVGDVAREVAKKRRWPGWIQAVLAFVKGIRIPVGGGVNVVLSEKHRPLGLFDEKGRPR